MLIGLNPEFKPRLLGGFEVMDSKTGLFESIEFVLLRIDHGVLWLIDTKTPVLIGFEDNYGMESRLPQLHGFEGPFL